MRMRSCSACVDYQSARTLALDMVGGRDQNVFKLNGRTRLTAERERHLNTFVLVDTDSPPFASKMEVIKMVLKGFRYGKRVRMKCYNADAVGKSPATMSEAEKIISCPFNRAHSVLKGRNQFHLTRCRKQHPCADMGYCPYNSTHIFPKSETEDMIEGSVLDTIKENAKNKSVLIGIVGAPKAERKAHRFQERLRFQRVNGGEIAQAQTETAAWTQNNKIKDVQMPQRVKSHGTANGNGCQGRQNHKAPKGGSNSILFDPGLENLENRCNNRATRDSSRPIQILGKNNFDEVERSTAKSASSPTKQADIPLNFSDTSNKMNGIVINGTRKNSKGKQKNIVMESNQCGKSDFPILPIAGRGRGKSRNPK
ncbi:hypothetical protein AAG570_004194 [Ranatra chinensis]|uniref:CHHC U11-48K-type domain-containing protein n=1 Tax=Ranatra chinensis TaxID=642074 RepID=A0ABD0Y364_9HEMI